MAKDPRYPHTVPGLNRPQRSYAQATSRAIVTDAAKFALGRDEKICVYCGAPALHADHVIPTALGGPTSTGNLIAACISCTMKKRGNLPMVMILRAIDHLINCGEDVGWMYEYGDKVLKMRNRLHKAENVATFLFNALPERVVAESLPLIKKTTE